MSHAITCISRVSDDMGHAITQPQKTNKLSPLHMMFHMQMNTNTCSYTTFTINLQLLYTQ